MATVVQFVTALLVVLGMIGLLAWGGRRFGFLPGALPRKKGQGRRLSIVEIAPVDTKRRLLLIRRDTVEHLVLLGPTADLLLESSIATSNGAGTAVTPRRAGVKVKEEETPWNE